MFGVVLTNSFLHSLCSVHFLPLQLYMTKSVTSFSGAFTGEISFLNAVHKHEAKTQRKPAISSKLGMLPSM